MKNGGHKKKSILSFLAQLASCFRTYVPFFHLKNKMPSLLFLYKAYLPKLNLKVIPLPRPEDIRDFSGQIAEKDIPVLISAIRSKADFLVTGDKQHFGRMKKLDKYPFHVLTPSEFIDSILPEILKGLEEKE